MPDDSMTVLLGAAAPDSAMASKLDLYGRFVGSWELDVTFHAPDGTTRRTDGEWHFAWVLDGKAVQDVWIVPSLRLRRRDAAEPQFYGSTMRWYDPAIDAWHITYFDPGIAFQLRQVGRAQGSDIVQVGDMTHGVLARWRFLDIARDSFRWLGERSWDRGATWSPQTEFRARRMPVATATRAA
jgi:hypothetical protein